MFSNASNFVSGVDSAFLFIIAISLFFLVFLTGLMIYFIVRYNKKRHPKAIQVKDSTTLEVTWTVIPLILALAMFYIGWKDFLPMRQVPADAMKVKAIGKMWKWEFEYPGNKVSDTLVVPIDKAIRVELVSTDVLHGFSVPAFRIKEDVVPRKGNYSWFKSGELGGYNLFCTVYCGLSHSGMSGELIKVVSQADFDAWIKKVPVRKILDNNKGYNALQKNGCIACHTVDGKTTVGPSFKGLYGKTIEVTENGATKKVVADSAYIETSILDPNKQVHNGFPQGVMKSYKGIVSADEIKAISDYIKSIK
ncbi:MAG: cytochrome c oxidase subunit II [Bacteroidales bacterium]